MDSAPPEPMAWTITTIECDEHIAEWADPPANLGVGTLHFPDDSIAAVSPMVTQHPDYGVDVVATPWQFPCGDAGLFVVYVVPNA